MDLDALLDHSWPPVLAGALILWGLVNCFFGYRIIRFLVVLWGMAIGASVGAWAARTLAEDSDALLAAGALSLGVLGALASSFLYLVGVALLGGAASFALVEAAAASSGRELHPVALGVVALLGGVAAAAIQKPLLILATAFGGAWSVAAGLLFFLSREGARGSVLLAWVAGEKSGTLGPADMAGVVACLVLGTGGVIVQFAYDRSRSRDEEPPQSSADYPTPRVPGG